MTKKVAREIVQEKFPSKSQREKQEAQAKKQKESQKEPIHIPNATEQHKESLPSQQLLAEQPRQFVREMSANSSKRSGKTLPAKTVLDNTLSEWFLQDKDNDFGKGELRDLLIKLKNQIEKKEIDVVDNLWKSGGEITEKNT